MIKEGSSSLAMVSLTCALPLSNMAFTSKDLVGKCSKVHLSINNTIIYLFNNIIEIKYLLTIKDKWDFIGLGIVVFGLIVYR